MRLEMAGAVFRGACTWNVGKQLGQLVRFFVFLGQGHPDHGAIPYHR